MQNFMKKHLVAAIALSLSAGVVLAAEAPKNQAEWKKIKAYGNTAVADDSVLAWGPWTEFAATAAGQSATTLQRIEGAGAEQYRPLPVATGGVITGACVEGSICGYGTYSSGYGGYGMMPAAVAYGGYGGSVSPMKIVATNVSVSSYGGNVSYGSAITPTVAYGGYFQVTGDLAFTQLQAGDPAAPAPATGRYLSPYDSTQDPMGKDSFFLAYVSGYVSGQSYFGFVGNITPAADMSALRASNRVATYYGDDFNGRSVSMTANLGQGTWTGSFDSYQSTDQSFKVTGGTISGSNFGSSQLSTTNVSGITGNVQGSFIGAGANAAQGVVGVYDVKLGGVRQSSGFYGVQGRSKE